MAAKLDRRSFFSASVPLLAAAPGRGIFDVGTGQIEVGVYRFDMRQQERRHSRRTSDVGRRMRKAGARCALLSGESLRSGRFVVHEKRSGGPKSAQGDEASHMAASVVGPCAAT